VYRIEIKKIKNTDKFREAAIRFENLDYYCPYQEGTSAFIEYWEREKDRCLHGYTAEDGDYITGYHYFYLNYFQIIKVVKSEKSGKNIKVKGFPRYWDYDMEFFLAIEQAEKTGHHLVVLKARRKGYSYKVGSMLDRNFYLIPESKNYAFAGEMEFLIKDGILSKAWDGMDFIDENTAWYKKRQKTDTKLHKRASYVYDKDGVKIEGGYKSEIIGVSLKNDANKIRGKAGRLMIYEEAGKFPNLKEAWMVAKHSLEQGDDVFGLSIAFGTGGTGDANYEGLKDLFYEPEAYGCLEIENIWDDSADRACGFFAPVYYNFSENYMDEDGNSDIKGAVKYCLGERERIISTASDRHTIDRYVAEMPFTPQEATLQISGNIFPKEELTKHLAHIRTNQKIKDQKQVGELVENSDGTLEWKQSKYPNDITSYRLKKDDDKRGSVVIWEHPEKEAPYGLYIAATDPYDHDVSTTNSLGSTFIYKRFFTYESYYDIIVAEYTGRPDTAEEYYENVRKLLLYYNARCLYENEKKGMFQYFKNKHYDYLLADQPDIIDDIVKDSKVQRKKGIHATTGIQDWSEGKLKSWLVTPRGGGKMNLHTIMSEPLLEELIGYNPDGNFDRVIAVQILMIFLEELHNINVKSKNKESKEVKFLANPLFLEEAI